MSVEGRRDSGLETRGDAGAPLAASALAGLARLISGASVRWLCPEPPAGQFVYFANHSSHFDFLVLWSSLPARLRRFARPVAARDYWQAGRLRRYMATRIFNAVLIERRRLEGQQNDAIDVMLAAMGEHCSLILFPEGTRGSGPDPAPFRSGLYNLALRRPGLQFVPVYLANLNRILPKGEFLPVPLTSSVSFGAPLMLRQDEDREAFMTRAREAVLALRPQ
jgi:1-acyl-sn-glycerol-3-phosphate acyltransferase